MAPDTYLWKGVSCPASLLYTDYIIYSPRVPFFRDDRLAFLESPFCASAPAPKRR
jgi:uncharacterized protein (TIGR02452 family)